MHVAPIIRRSDWSCDREFVGHDQPVVVARWNPCVFRAPKENGQNINDSPYLCCALGGQDRTVSIWMTNRTRAVCVVKNLFVQSVLDISWTSNGYSLLICSGDSTIAFLNFKDNCLGEAVPQSEIDMKLKQLYGDLHSDVSIGNIIEDPNQIILEEKLKERERRKEENKKKKLNTRITNNSVQKIVESNIQKVVIIPDISLVDPKPSETNTVQNTTGNIQQTVPKPGKKRIAPQFLGDKKSNIPTIVPLSNPTIPTTVPLSNPTPNTIPLNNDLQTIAPLTNVSSQESTLNITNNNESPNIHPPVTILQPKKKRK